MRIHNCTYMSFICLCLLGVCSIFQRCLMNPLVGRSMSSPLGFSGINMPTMSQGGSPGSMTQVSVDRDQIFHWIQELSSSDSGVREQALMELRYIRTYVHA